MITYERDIELRHVSKEIESLDKKVLYIIHDDYIKDVNTYEIMFRPKYKSKIPKNFTDNYKHIDLRET